MNADDNDTVDNDTGNTTVIINEPVTKEVKKDPVVKKNDTKPYLVDKVWSPQQEGFLYYYSDGSVYNEQGQRVDNLS